MIETWATRLKGLEKGLDDPEDTVPGYNIDTTGTKQWIKQLIKGELEEWGDDE